MRVTPPPLLLGAALLFWGWQTGFLFLALPLAVLVEAGRALTWRLELSATDFHRLTDLCTLLIVVSGIYLFSTTGTSRAADGPRAMTLLFQWLPLLFFPLFASQVYSTAGKVPLTAFFWALRRQAAHAPETRPGFVDLGYLYFALCILAASAANRRTPEFYAGLCALAGWALWSWRSRRFSPLWWIPMLGVAATAGYAGHIALHRAQQVVEQTVFDYIFSMVRGDADPFRVTTAIGQLGRLKLSDRTILRVEPREGLRLPFLLREASYDVYNSPAWLASGAAFSAVQPEADGETWRFAAGRSLPAERITVSAYLNRGRGVLSLPGGAFEIDRLAVVGVHRNRLGAVRVEEGLGLVTYTTLFAPDGPLDGPPIDADLHVPPREAAIVSRIAADLNLAGGPATEKVETVAAYFRRNFRYSTWRGERPRKESALEEFLLNARAGHCEYFATATTLLLRAAGVPARYAVGFSVQEWSRLEQRYVVRARHAHSWTLAYVNGAWRDVDTTPPAWAGAEQSEASFLEPVRDLWSWAGFLFARWRWSEDDSGIGRHAAWLLIPLVLLLVWRLYSRRRVGRDNTGPRVTVAVARPGQDSEFYLIAERLRAAGLGRQGDEPPFAWIERIHATELTPILDLHYRYRFDPAGLDATERSALRAQSEVWLRLHQSTEATVTGGREVG
jgi:transglutaminase-like putative cysteine protease